MSKKSQPIDTRALEYKNSSIDNSRFSDFLSGYLDKIVYRYKLILVGDYCVGKTAIISRFIDDKYNGEYKCTLGVEFKVKSFHLDDSTAIDLQVWDTCGHDKYRSITKQYFRNKSGKNYLFLK